MKKKLLFIVVLSSMALHAADDRRPQGSGGNPPAWSNFIFQLRDTLDNGYSTVLRKALAMKTNGRLFVTGLFSYIAYRAKDTVIDHVNNLPDTVATIVNFQKEKESEEEHEEKIRALQPARN